MKDFKPASAASPALALALAMILGLAAGASAQPYTSYQSILPDTLQPGKTYVILENPPMTLKVSAAAAAGSDSVLLKGNGTTFAMTLGMGTTGVKRFETKTPLDAAPGAYSVYSTKNVLIEANATVVANPKTVVPYIRSMSIKRGVRGSTYRLEIEAMGPAFGPLQTTGEFASALKSAILDIKTTTIKLDSPTVIDPYTQAFTLRIPASADLGMYFLRVQRMDGTETLLERAFEVWAPPAPDMQSVIPDSLVIGEEGTLGITGANMAYGIRQGSSTFLNREIVKEVHLRQADRIVPATSYPELGWFSSPTSNINATFKTPEDVAPGRYDLGLVLNGRPDTSYLRNAIRVLVSPGPRIVSVQPDTMDRKSGFTAYIGMRKINEDLSAAAFLLIDGNRSLTGKFRSASADMAWVDFNSGMPFDTGTYDLEIQGAPGGKTYRFPEAVRIVGPSIRSVRPAGFAAGEDSAFLIEVVRADFDYSFKTGAGEPNIRSASLCKGADCIEGQGVNAQYFYFSANFKASESQPVGAYDLRIRIAEPDQIITREAAVVVGPKGYRVWLPTSGISQRVSHWAVKAGTASGLNQGLDPLCALSSYSLENGAPAGMTFFNGALAWQPAVTDTGWHMVRISTLGSCSDKVSLAVHVVPDPAIGIRIGDRPGSTAGDAGLAGVYPSGFRIRLDQGATIDIHSLQGRLLASHGRLAGGTHFIPYPKSHGGEAVFLCRVRRSGGEGWLRILRMP